MAVALLDGVRAAAAEDVAAIEELHELPVLGVHLRRLHLVKADGASALAPQLLDQLLEGLERRLQALAVARTPRLLHALHGRADVDPLLLRLPQGIEEGRPRVLHAPTIVVGAGEERLVPRGGAWEIRIGQGAVVSALPSSAIHRVLARNGAGRGPHAYSLAMLAAVKLCAAGMLCTLPPPRCSAGLARVAAGAAAHGCADTVQQCNDWLGWASLLLLVGHKLLRILFRRWQSSADIRARACFLPCSQALSTTSCLAPYL